jgi:hypothetical protein
VSQIHTITILWRILSRRFWVFLGECYSKG